LRDVPEGFAEFVATRQKALQRDAWLLTGDWSSAEDLVQSTLAKVWPRWDNVRRANNADAYVRRALVNSFLSSRKRRWRSESPTADLPDGANPTDVATEVLIRIAVQAALAELTERQRAMVMLRWFDDLPEVKVAELLNCSVGTVKSTVARALTKLRNDERLSSALKESQ
jgi:RNA polymerase sigma-70 factor (sigma-E family)